MYFSIHSGSCAPAESQGQGLALFGAPRMQRDLPSLATVFSQTLAQARIADLRGLAAEQQHLAAVHLERIPAPALVAAIEISRRDGQAQP